MSEREREREREKERERERRREREREREKERERERRMAGTRVGWVFLSVPQCHGRGNCFNCCFLVQAKLNCILFKITPLAEFSMAEGQ